MLIGNPESRAFSAAPATHTNTNASAERQVEVAPVDEESWMLVHQNNSLVGFIVDRFDLR